MIRRALSAGRSPRRPVALFLSVALVLSALAAVAADAARAQLPAPPEVVVKAGYGEADATWHVGAGAGQYTAKSPDQTELVSGGDVDPHGHSTT